MDRVRFGRALGYGARHAAKTLLQAADAAAAPGSAGTEGVSQASGAQTTAERVRASAPAAVRRVAEVRRTAGVAGQQAKKSFFAPLARFSGVLWLQVTGTFFAVIAVAMGSGAWRLRGALHGAGAPGDLRKLCVFGAVFLVFAYFAVSSFVRAERR
ncbi:MAG TPA: hypothetical protein VM865_01235 [Acidobacteriaceae bacterium]|jgi:hypothetical protein|nr:hypothetical protein [Acidobacteriaceae bacterium]